MSAHSLRRLILAVILVVIPALVLAQREPRPPGEKYALLVGVRSYDPNELRSLPYSESDAVALAEVLRAQGYGPDNVVVMTQTAGAEDPRFAPEAAKIRNELSLLLRIIEPEDSIVVAFAGHGVQLRGDSESYFCPETPSPSLAVLPRQHRQGGDGAELVEGHGVTLQDAILHAEESIVGMAMLDPEIREDRVILFQEQPVKIVYAEEVLGRVKAIA